MCPNGVRILYPVATKMISAVSVAGGMRPSGAMLEWGIEAMDNFLELATQVTAFAWQETLSKGSGINS
jgi:hypothetical protein